MPPVSVFGGSTRRFLKETVTFFPWAKLLTSYRSHKGRQLDDWSYETHKGPCVFLDQDSGEVPNVDRTPQLDITRNAKFHQLQLARHVV